MTVFCSRHLMRQEGHTDSSREQLFDAIPDSSGPNVVWESPSGFIAFVLFRFNYLQILDGLILRYHPVGRLVIETVD